MTLQELINAVMLKATGKPTILPTTNTKWEKIRGIANYYQQAWAHEPGQHWRSLYIIDNIATISHDSEYLIPGELDDISTALGDNIYVKTTDGKKIEFQLVDHNDFQNHPTGNYCTIVGHDEDNGRYVLFNGGFMDDDPCYGGELYVPAYYKIGPCLTDPDDVVVVDDPNWLVTMCAAEYIRNDIVKQNQYGNLIAEANNLMTSMIHRNRVGQVRHIRGNFKAPGGLAY